MPTNRQTLAIMFTFTTYGTWLRGDKRGWVQHGKVFPENPQLESADRTRMKHETFYFQPDQCLDVGNWIGTELINRLDVTILAMTVRTWHLHFLIKATNHDVGKVAKCAKEAVRYHLNAGRPIWTTGYDKRFSFDESTVLNRVKYIERHNTEMNLAPRPWNFIQDWRE